MILLRFFSSSFFRIPFPDLVDTNSFESKDAYIQFIKSKLQTALDFPNMNSCFVNGTVTLPTEKQ